MTYAEILMRKGKRGAAAYVQVSLDSKQNQNILKALFSDDSFTNNDVMKC